METPKLDFFLGKIREVKDRVTYEVTVDIPGIGEELKAYPYSRGEMDEPVPGNLVYLLSVDPMYHSVFLYLKAKENDFIGVRSNGKLIDITPEAITIGVYPEDDESRTLDEERPDPSKSYLKMDKSGNIEIMATGDETIKISGSASIEISGDSKVCISGNASIDVSGDTKLTSKNVNLEASGECEVKSPKVTITGGQLITNGQANTDMQGPYNCIKICPFSSLPHSGSIVSGT